MFDIQTHVQDVVGGADHSVVGKACESKRGTVGASVGLAIDSVWKENSVGPGLDSLMGAEEYTIGGIMPDRYGIGVPRTHIRQGNAIDGTHQNI